jgi:tryptophan 7-halogenase
MATGPLEKIVIVGGGTAGWITAAVLARFLRARAAIELIESEEIGIVGVGEATVPVIRALNGLLGIDERDFLAATQATYKLGVEFRDWARRGNVHFHFFGDFGDVIDGIAPHHHWLKLRRRGDATPLGDYCFPYVAGKLARFAPPASDPRSPAADFRYAYHFDAGLYAQYLRAVAERHGVRRIEGKVADVRLRPQDGFIESLALADGKAVSGELFIDASGFRGLLIEQALRTGYDDWSEWLPCDRAVAVACESAGDLTAELTPYTMSTARTAGWQWRIPLRHRIGNGHVYCSGLMSDEEAEAQLLGTLEGRALGEPRLLKFTTGVRRQVWSRNCVAVGLAAGFLEPLESTGIQLIQNAAARLVDFFPDRGFDPMLAAEYNRLTRNEYERLRDFLIAHYCVTERDDSPFWRHCRTMDLPQGLRHKIDVWTSCARVPLYSEESYQEPSWVAILLGQHLYPKRYDPFVDNIDEMRLQQGMLQRRAAIRRLAEAMPSHRDFISRQLGREAGVSSPAA